MSAAITCTSCNRPLRVPESVLGQTVQCPLCLDEFIAQADPAAEAAARAAEPPARRAAPSPNGVAAHVADDRGAARRRGRGGRAGLGRAGRRGRAGEDGRLARTAEGRTFAFPVLVTRDPDRVLRGRMDGELTDRGSSPAANPRNRPPSPPSAARPATRRQPPRRHRRGPRRSSWSSTSRGPPTITWPATWPAFLNGQRGFPRPPGLRLPWYLYCLPALFLALPFAAGPFGLLDRRLPGRLPVVRHRRRPSAGPR